MSDAGVILVMLQSHGKASESMDQQMSLLKDKEELQAEASRLSSHLQSISLLQSEALRFSVCSRSALRKLRGAH